MFVKPAAIVSALSSTTSVSATERTMSCCYDIQKPARPTSVRVLVELARGILEVDQDTIQPGLKPIPAHSYAYANNLTLCLGRERGTRKPSRNGTKESNNSRTEGLDLLRRLHVSRM